MATESTVAVSTKRNALSFLGAAQAKLESGMETVTLNALESAIPTAVQTAFLMRDKKVATIVSQRIGAIESTRMVGARPQTRMRSSITITLRATPELLEFSAAREPAAEDAAPVA